jgi:Ornithine cyclodeaminase/mu-crystallin family
VVTAGHIKAELGEVLAGTAPGRTAEDEITVFKSIRLAFEDLAAAEYLERRALGRGSSDGPCRGGGCAASVPGLVGGTGRRATSAA